MTDAKTILGFGETLWDLFPSGPVLGGAPFNLAWRLHERGHRAAIATALGRDGLGDQAFDAMTRLGVDARFVERDAIRRTGMVEVRLDEEHNPEFDILPNAAYEAIEPTEALLDYARSADCIAFGTLAQRGEVSRETLRQALDAADEAAAFYDINLRPNCWTEAIVTESLERADLVKLNVDEAGTLQELYGFEATELGDLCREIADRWSLSVCLVTMGPRGAFGYSTEPTEGPNPVYVPGFAVEAVDTTGSGDAFAAGFLHRWLTGAMLGECVRYGNALGAAVATKEGATAPVSHEEIETLLRGGPPAIDREGLDAFLGGDEEG